MGLLGFEKSMLAEIMLLRHILRFFKGFLKSSLFIDFVCI